MSWGLFALAAVLLAAERVVYVTVCRTPQAVVRLSRRPGLARLDGPVNLVAAGFLLFKALQAGVFLTWCGVHGGGLLPHVWSTGASGSGLVLILVGQALSLSVFRRLGKVGVFYGSSLGYRVPWRQGFPFTWFAHPQYVGTVLSIWGFFLIMRFPAGDWAAVPLLETLYYAIGAHFERPPVAASAADERPGLLEA